MSNYTEKKNPEHNPENQRRKAILYLCLCFIVLLPVLIGCSWFKPKKSSVVNTPVKNATVQESKENTALPAEMLPVQPGGVILLTDKPASAPAGTAPAATPTLLAQNLPSQPAASSTSHPAASSTSQPAATSTPHPAATSTSHPAATRTPRPQNTNIPGPSNTPAVPTETPIFRSAGISPAALKSKLETDELHKFTCSPSEKKKDVNAITCDYSTLVEMKSTKYHVEIYSKTATADTVTLIYTVISQDAPDTQKSIDILGYIGSLPLGGDAAKVSEMRTWIAGNINSATTQLNQVTNQFGGVTYTLYGTPNNWFLEIGDPTI